MKKLIINPQKLRTLIAELIQCADTGKKINSYAALAGLGETFTEEDEPRWEPKNESYYCIDDRGGVAKVLAPVSLESLQKRLDFNNVFKTKEEAEEARDAIKKLLQERKA